ncbi:unnamed protein product [Hyaloperonospora brassicae]|uniref:N-acetyltransferase domain-containing protein n=1 Tax=Hyaloperonospora brassicae TaxID=162125 RepID=A0AAV0TK66_HYABA|nr:unnamed protein product [Hyaloperonospora brassicae]
MELVKATKKTKAEWLAQTVRLEKNHNTLFMAMDTSNAIVLGYVLFRRNGTEGHVDRIAVAEHHRRQGLARYLLQSAIATLRTNRYVQRATTFVLEVDTTNEGAIALYESHGFKRTSVRADYYKPGHDALLMELRL